MLKEHFASAGDPQTAPPVDVVHEYEFAAIGMGFLERRKHSELGAERHSFLLRLFEFGRFVFGVPLFDE